MNAGVTLQSLRDCLSEVRPVELKGMALLKERRPQGQFFPRIGEESSLSREIVAEAITEIVAYTQRCRLAAERLSDLTSIPVTAFSALEYGL